MKLNRKDFDVLVQGVSGSGPVGDPPDLPEGVDIIPPDDKPDNPDSGDGDGDGDGPDNTSTISDIKKGQQPKDDDEKGGGGKGKSGQEQDGGSGGGSEGKKGQEKDGKSGSGAGKSGKDPLELDGRGMGGVLTPEESKRMQEELGVPYEAPFDESAIKNKLAELYPLLDKSKGTRTYGGSAGNQKRLLPDAIAKILKPVVDWKALLKKFIARTLGRKDEDILPNRRYASGGDYYQGTRELNNNFNTCVIAVDTSGSMGAKELITILNEIKGLAQTNRINNFDIVYFDAGIRDVEHLTTAKIKNYNPSPPGGGGTTFQEPLEYMEKIRKTGKLDLAIFMTDGYADLNLAVPRYKDKFIWVILDNPSFKAPWGSKLVHIEVPRGKG